MGFSLVRTASDSFFQRLKEEWLCLFPILGLFLVVTIFYSLVIGMGPLTVGHLNEQLVSPLTLTGSSHNVAILDQTSLTQDQKLEVNNTALLARCRWIYVSCVYLCVCGVSLVAGASIAVTTLRGIKKRFLAILCLLVTGLSLASISGQHGLYPMPEKLFAETIGMAQPTGYKFIFDFTVALDKLAFAVAFFLVSAASLCLFNFRANQLDADDRLGKQMGQLRALLYIATAVLVFSILFWNFTLRWTLAYIYPYSGSVYASVESLVNGIVTTRGLYFTCILASTYLPTAFIQQHRAQKLADLSNPGATTADKEEWLKKRGLTTSPLDVAPRLVAILGPILAGSFTDLLSLLK